MYIQITSKCNMTCAHCCYSCNKNGKHMDYEDVKDAIHIASQCDEMVAIGGGEPTLHPRFFDILKLCLRTFDYVWFATNGSQTKTMYRLYNILMGEDYPENYDEDDYSAFDNCINAEGKLTVALSQDYYHSPINDRIVRLWRQNKNRQGFEVRDVSGKVIGVGRELRTGEYQETKGCVCPETMIRANGSIHACGCKNSPKIGSVNSGITQRIWKKVHDNKKYQDTNCGAHIRIKEAV